MMNGNVLSKSRLKIMSVLLSVTWVLVFLQFQNLYVMSLLQDAANTTLRSETLRETVCDAVITNGGVREP